MTIHILYEGLHAHLCINPPINMPVLMSTWLSKHMSVHMSIHMSTHMSTHSSPDELGHNMSALCVHAAVHAGQAVTTAVSPICAADHAHVRYGLGFGVWGLGL